MPHKGCLFLGLIACLVVAAGPGRVEAGDGQVIQKVSAIGQRNLRPVTVKDGWEIQWDSKGSLLTITVFNADRKLVDIAATQKGPGSGSSYRRKGGDYYLRVSGTGKWTVTVVQLP